MVHTQQFTPQQLLEAGRRAESEGRHDLASQFYRHLTEHYAYTEEAAEARNGLGRVGAAQSHIWLANGAGHANGTARPLRRRPVAPRDHYRVGRVLARLVSGTGWVTVACGVAAPAVYLGLGHFLPSLALPQLGPAHALAGAAGMIAAGALVVLAGQIARALLDQVNAVRDLAALERAKVAAD